MADQQYSTVQESETAPKVAGESMNCEMVLNKEQNQKLQEDAAMTDAKTMKEEEKTTLMEELHRSKSNSSSVSYCITKLTKCLSYQIKTFYT